MNVLDLGTVEHYVNENIDDFHRRRLATVENLALTQLLKKNPYLSVRAFSRLFLRFIASRILCDYADRTQYIGLRVTAHVQPC